jgi:hypothetical protein
MIEHTKAIFKQRNMHFSDDDTVAAQLNTTELHPVLTI